jgi:hypothetical protein
MACGCAAASRAPVTRNIRPATPESTKWTFGFSEARARNVVPQAGGLWITKAASSRRTYSSAVERSIPTSAATRATFITCPVWLPSRATRRGIFSRCLIDDSSATSRSITSLR